MYGCVGGFKDLPGVLADYALADARLLAKKPANLSMVEASALPLVTITAWNALMDRAKVSEDQKVLVHAAAGGVGHVALQLAKAGGAEVHVTASTEEKIALGKELGADVGINYKTEDVAARFQELCPAGIDVYWDNVGGPVTDAAMDQIAINGCAVICGQIALYNATSPPQGPRNISSGR